MTADPNTPLPALAPGRVAVITGAASGIGLAAAKRLAALGMKIVSPTAKAAARPRRGERRGDAAGGAATCSRSPATCRSRDDLARSPTRAYEKFGEVSFLMNNAGVGNNPGKPWENLDAWKKLIDMNFWGVVHGVQAFGQRMLAQGTPAIIVNTGSKQGITTPPGNLAYNVSKAR